MSRFYFHVYDDHTCTDDEGQEFPGVAGAEAEALRSARSLACEQVAAGRLNLSHRIEIADEAGTVVKAITFGDAVKVEA